MPTGATHTLIKLIVPPKAFFDAGLDNGLTIDFEKVPTELTIIDGTSATVYPFPTITVDGTLVTVVTTITFITSDYEVADVRTLTIKRSKP